MANEFDKRTENGRVVWTCRICKKEIICTSKPRDHICNNHGQNVSQNPTTSQSEATVTAPTSTPGTTAPPVSTTSTPSTPSTPRFSHPLPMPNNQFGNVAYGSMNQNQNFQNFQPYHLPQNMNDPMNAMQMQMLQIEQHKQTMELLKEQSQMMMKRMDLDERRMDMDKENRLQMAHIEKERTTEIINNLKNDKRNDTKPVKCPRWSKDEHFRNFKRRLEHWDNIEQGKGKYLKLIEALQQEGRKKEKERVELEEQNKLINPDDENVIKEIIIKMEKWFGKPKLDQACESWKDFKEVKRKESETLDDFILRFETVESNLKCSVVELPQLILALQLVETLNISADQKRNILANIKIENTETIYEDIKSSVRLLKGVLVEGNGHKEDNVPEDVNYVDNNRRGNRNTSRSRSKSRHRFPSRSFKESRGEERNNRDKGYNERGRSRDRNYKYRESGRSWDRNNRSQGGRSSEGNNSYKILNSNIEVVLLLLIPVYTIQTLFYEEKNIKFFYFTLDSYNQIHLFIFKDYRITMSID